MDDRQRLRRKLLFVVIGFIVLLYLLGAAALWARSRFLNDAPLPHLPALIERTMKPFADMF